MRWELVKMVRSMKRWLLPRTIESFLLSLLPFFLSYEGATAQEISWSEVKNWAYQLQGYPGNSLSEIAGSAYDLVVIDYSRNGMEAGEWLPLEISEAQNGSGGAKKIISYMSIGQAEDYRFYWQDWWEPGNPDFLLGEDPDWPGNYWVEYWNPEWQAILMGSPESYLDRIIAQGFDGVYLDRVDACGENFAEGHLQDMVELVISIAQYARAHSPLGENFAIFPQNAAPLGQIPAYLEAVNGIGKEETYFLATDIPTTQKSRYWDEIDLNRFLQAGPWGFGLVLEVDYAVQRSHIDYVYTRCENFTGYLPYCTTVDLDHLTVNPGHEPDDEARIWGIVSLGGAPVEGGRVDMVRLIPKPIVHKWCITDPQGRFLLKYLSAGTYYVRAMKNPYVSDIVRVILEEDGIARVDLSLHTDNGF
jgi:cysteinyl-tRNA synthetase